MTRVYSSQPRITFRLTTVLCLLVFGAVATLAAADVESARKLENAGDVSQAFDVYRAWLKEHPADPDFSSVLLHAADICEDTTAAVGLLENGVSAVDSGADRNSVLRKLAQFEELIGRLEAAQKHYEAAAGAENGRKDYRSLLSSAELLFTLGSVPESETRARAILLTCSDDSVLQAAYRLYARILGVQGKFGDGIGVLEKLMKTYPDSDSPETLLLLAYLYGESGNSDEKAAVLKRLKSAYPDSPEAGISSEANSNGKSAVIPFPEPFLYLDVLPSLTENPETGTEESALAADSSRENLSSREAENSEEILIQTGAFTRKENAIEMQDRLKSRGFDSVIREKTLRGQLYYRVFLPVAGTEEEAAVILMRLKEAGFEGFLVFE